MSVSMTSDVRVFRGRTLRDLIHKGHVVLTLYDYLNASEKLMMKSARKKVLMVYSTTSLLATYLRRLQVIIGYCTEDNM